MDQQRSDINDLVTREEKRRTKDEASDQKRYDRYGLQLKAGRLVEKNKDDYDSTLPDRDTRDQGYGYRNQHSYA